LLAVFDFQITNQLHRVAVELYTYQHCVPHCDVLSDLENFDLHFTSMLRFSTTLPGMTRSGHRPAGITIAVGLTGAAPVGSLRMTASFRRAVTQQQQTRATTTGMMGVVKVEPLGSLPRTVASLRRASIHPSSPVNPDDRGKSPLVMITPPELGDWSVAALTAFVLGVLAVWPDAWKETLLVAFYASMTGWRGVVRLFVCLCITASVLLGCATVASVWLRYYEIEAIKKCFGVK
jgi:hypothetical protein